MDPCRHVLNRLVSDVEAIKRCSDMNTKGFSRNCWSMR